MSDQLPDIFGAASDLKLADGGIYPARLLVSHGKEDGVLAGAWEKYGKLEQGDLVIQDSDDFFLCHPKDYWFILPATAFSFAGVRDAWTKKLTSASFDSSRSDRGGDLNKQLSVAAIFMPTTEIPEREELPKILAVYISVEKAKVVGPTALLKALDRYAPLESTVPPAFRVFAHFFGKVTKTRPENHPQGKTFLYSGIEARTKQTPEDLLKRLGSMLPDIEDQLRLIQDKIQEEREEVRKIEAGEDLPTK